MLSDLLVHTDITKPLIITIVGDSGIGKTTLASRFPKPVFIRLEDGTLSIKDNKEVKLFPVAKDVKTVFNYIKMLAIEEHDFKTLVIDSISQFNTLIEAEILASDQKAKSLNQAFGGYGAGFNAVAEMHRKFREWCDVLSSDKRMNIIFISHSDIETIEPPDTDAYSRYTLRMHKKSTQHYIDNVDVVAYIKLKTYTQGDSKDKVKKAITSGQRIITCYPTPNHVSKNRLGIEQDLIIANGENPFLQYLQ